MIYRFNNLKKILMETAKNLFTIISLLASTGFSIFMMYSMYKTKKGVEKISENATKLTDTLTEQMQNLPNLIGTILNPAQATNYEQIEDKERPAFNNLILPDIYLNSANYLMKGRNSKEFLNSVCCGDLITTNNKDELTCINCKREVNEKGELLNY